MKELERYHAGLAVRAALVALLAAVLVAVTGRPRAGGRVLVAVVVAIGVVVERGFVSAAVGAAAVVALAVAWPAAGGIRDTPLVPALAVVSLVGVWLAVPDTEVPVVAATVVGVVVGVLGVRRAVVADRLAALAAVAGAALLGASHRPELVGGLGCAGLLLVPMGRSVGRDLRSAAIVLGLHAAVVAVAARVVSRLDRGPAVVVIVAIVAAAGVGVRTCAAAPGSRTP